MQTEIIDLYKYFDIEIKCVSHTELTEILPVKCIRPAMVVVPGGGYSFVSQREDEPIALKFLAEGYNTFSLDYSINVTYPAQLLELSMAMVYLRRNANKYCIDANKICAVGFSAGGHLVGSLATRFNDKLILDLIKCSEAEVKPNATILSYAVVSFDDVLTHSQTKRIVTGGDEQLIKHLDVVKSVSSNTPPMFIWATSQDDAVPVANSIKLALSCQENNVEYELHIFQNGWHGLSTGDDISNYDKDGNGLIFDCAKWIPLSLKWLKDKGFKLRYFNYL